MLVSVLIVVGYPVQVRRPLIVAETEVAAGRTEGGAVDPAQPELAGEVGVDGEAGGVEDPHSPVLLYAGQHQQLPGRVPRQAVDLRGEV